MSNGYQDRGNKKWSAMLLPEHRERLRQMAENEQKVVKPRLDADQWEDLNYKIQAALIEKRIITITHFKHDAVIDVAGTISKYDPINRTLHVQEDERLIKIKLSNIIEVRDF
ncbi:YolD-like family protein [Paenibacillus hunanensis]|uniref:YolD-like family protein n=1 Tax=Paenibacillus hunanensis TaxID=539262 RepID=A0ABU1IVC9_9BACL|nr:YolD-like family protein [Paenibacillus hunanensis]MDR6243124.1 hypothetical protein [Paenibacillus hunanensis]GGJ11649.1 hypothetical protein GCM10008022_21010 [Paenibacillus hunanensis]